MSNEGENVSTNGIAEVSVSIDLIDGAATAEQAAFMLLAWVRSEDGPVGVLVTYDDGRQELVTVNGADSVFPGLSA